MSFASIVLATAVAAVPAIPPIAPGHDEVVLTNLHDPVAKECADVEGEIQKKMHFTTLQVVITKSPKWGAIWRADQEEPAKPGRPRYIIRSLCWADKSGTLILASPADMFALKDRTRRLK